MEGYKCFRLFWGLPHPLMPPYFNRCPICNDTEDGFYSIAM